MNRIENCGLQMPSICTSQKFCRFVKDNWSAAQALNFLCVQKFPKFGRTKIKSLSPARWHGKQTYLSSLGILGKKRNYFPKR